MDAKEDQNRFASAATRRSFLKQFTGGAVALSVFPGLKAADPNAALAQIAGSLTADDAGGETFWRMVKQQFLMKDGLILMNAANLCPSPHMVMEKVCALTRDEDADASFQNRAKFRTLLEESRKKLAAFTGATQDEIAIVRNTSEGNNRIVGGLQLGPGDEVLILDQNHPTNNIAWDVTAARFGFAVRRVSLNNPPAGVEEILKTFRDALSPRTKVLAFSDVSNTTGVRLPSKELCRLGRERGIYTHVDGAQTFGMMALDLHDLGCDSFAASSHKWFMGPKEAGLLYIRKERIAEIWPGVIGVGWGDKVETSAPGARKFETLGQRDDAAMAALGATVDFHNLIGRSRIEARVKELTEALKEGVSKLPKAQMVTPMKGELSAGICIAKFEGLDSRKMHEELYAKHSIAAAPTGGIRLSPHIYNTFEEVERVIAVLGKMVREMG
ncbi:MAG: aminotransferase class V-fold PLP-dependent enzyme [Blastocatellia bacterium]|nr:aminotransferase class V-fold PLP-dependent enzyme [Blastocatellia bacterium]